MELNKLILESISFRLLTFDFNPSPLPQPFRPRISAHAPEHPLGVLGRLAMMGISGLLLLFQVCLPVFLSYLSDLNLPFGRSR